MGQDFRERKKNKKQSVTSSSLFASGNNKKGARESSQPLFMTMNEELNKKTSLFQDEFGFTSVRAGYKEIPEFTDWPPLLV